MCVCVCSGARHVPHVGVLKMYSIMQPPLLNHTSINCRSRRAFQPESRGSRGAGEWRCGAHVFALVVRGVRGHIKRSVCQHRSRACMLMQLCHTATMAAVAWRGVASVASRSQVHRTFYSMHTCLIICATQQHTHSAPTYNQHQHTKQKKSKAKSLCQFDISPISGPRYTDT